MEQSEHYYRSAHLKTFRSVCHNRSCEYHDQLISKSQLLAFWTFQHTFEFSEWPLRCCLKTLFCSMLTIPKMDRITSSATSTHRRSTLRPEDNSLFQIPNMPTVCTVDADACDFDEGPQYPPGSDNEPKTPNSEIRLILKHRPAHPGFHVLPLPTSLRVPRTSREVRSRASRLQLQLHSTVGDIRTYRRRAKTFQNIIPTPAAARTWLKDVAQSSLCGVEWAIYFFIFLFQPPIRVIFYVFSELDGRGSWGSKGHNEKEKKMK